eukprot:TRINITY_DN1330_c0_g1_i2.p1 TRINITY_DN1330_c0_g1~~TRINITY_DN1330_c0_g1_i2.p1  ORF type:complete len:1353 (+),score=201.99 TRINITY_DN1330_c0_g1_i2:1374-5432(+)
MCKHPANNISPLPLFLFLRFSSSVFCFMNNKTSSTVFAIISLFFLAWSQGKCDFGSASSMEEIKGPVVNTDTTTYSALDDNLSWNSTLCELQELLNDAKIMYSQDEREAMVRFLRHTLDKWTTSRSSSHFVEEKQDPFFFVQKEDLFIEIQEETFRTRNLGIYVNYSSDCIVLKEIFETMGGLQWTNRDGWEDGVAKACCSGLLFGVICDINGRVHNLSLTNNNLNGSIPLSIGSLTELEYLSLSSNHIEGSVPDELGNLLNLKRIYLHANRFSGNIPETIGNLRDLSVLNIYTNAFSGEIPPSIGQLVNLKEFFAFSNLLTGQLPSEMSKMEDLEKVVLNGNRFTGNLPSFLSNLTKLQELKLYSNMFEGPIPEGYCKLMNLRSLDLHDNLLSGPLLPCLSDIPHLEHLILSQNKFDGGVPFTFCGMMNLLELDLHQNRFFGTIPDCLDGLINLLSLNLATNGFMNEIPECVGKIQNLSFLDLSLNLLNGTIPATLGGLVHLDTLDLSHNALHGVIPSSFSSLASLRVILLQQNEFNGGLEPLCFLEKLEEITIHGNKFSDICGSVDPQWGSLLLLSAGENELLSFPWNSLGKMKNLVSLDLSKNHLSGSFPLEVFLPNCSVEVLNLGQNSFEGWLPLDPCRGWGKTLTLLNVAGNRITGFYFLDRKSCQYCTSRDHTLGHLDLSECITQNSFIDQYPVEGSALACTSPPTSPLHLIKRLGGLYDLRIQHWPLESGVEEMIQDLSMLSALDLGGMSDLHKRENENEELLNYIWEEPVPWSTSYECYQTMSKDGRIRVQVDPTYWYYENCYCRSGFWGKPPHCRSCPNHAECPGLLETRNIQRAHENSGYIFASDGYWGSPESSITEMQSNEKYPSHFLACTGLGTDHTPCQSGEVGACERGYEGRLCSRCKKDFFKMGDRCIECAKGLKKVIFLCAVILVVSGIIFYSFVAGFGNGGLLKILVFFLQGLSYISIPVPSFIFKATNAGSYVVGLQVSGIECFLDGWTFYDQYITQVSMPILALVVVFSIWVCGVVIKSIRLIMCKEGVRGGGLGIPSSSSMSSSHYVSLSSVKKSEENEEGGDGDPAEENAAEEQSKKAKSFHVLNRFFPTELRFLSWSEKCVASFVFLQFLLYMGVSTMILKPLRCEKDPGNGQWYMKNVPYMPCCEILRLVSSFLIPMYVISLPAIVLYLTLKKLRQVRRTMHLLVVSFPKYVFWEVVIATRRIAFISAFLAISEYSSFRAFMIEAVLGISMIIQGVFRPFGRGFENGMELATLGVLAINHVVGAQMHGTRVEDDFAVQICIFCLNALVVIVILLELARRMFLLRQYRKSLRGSRPVRLTQPFMLDSEKN